MDPLLLVRMVECEESPEKVFSKLRLRLSAKRTAQSSQSVVVHAWTLEERKPSAYPPRAGHLPTTDLSGEQSKLASQGKNYCSGQCLLVFLCLTAPVHMTVILVVGTTIKELSLYTNEGKVCCVKEIQFGCSPYGCCCYCVSWPIYSTYITGPAGHLLATTY